MVSKKRRLILSEIIINFIKLKKTSHEWSKISKNILNVRMLADKVLVDVRMLDAKVILDVRMLDEKVILFVRKLDDKVMLAAALFLIEETAWNCIL